MNPFVTSKMGLNAVTMAVTFKRFPLQYRSPIHRKNPEKVAFWMLETLGMRNYLNGTEIASQRLPAQ